MTPVKMDVILVPTDFSDYFGEVMDRAVFLAKACGASIKLLHVVHMARLLDAVSMIDTTSSIIEADMHEEFRKSSTKQLKEIKDRYQDQGVDIEVVQADGVPFVEIIKAADRKKVDLIVMGSHGGSGISHLLLGSVADRVVHKASCPVMCIKPEDLEFEMPK